MTEAVSRQRWRPLAAAGLLLGAGLGGFVDGIVLHQILQLHNMLSAILPTNNVVDLKVNMFWDGIFHAGVWGMTVLGVLLLFRAGRNASVVWSGRALCGFSLIGWGTFNLVEGVINHHLLVLHHVVDAAANPFPADLAFLLSGLLLIGIGGGLVWQAQLAHAGKARPLPR
jgi:uncharacterized membrane protein